MKQKLCAIEKVGVSCSVEGCFIRNSTKDVSRVRKPLGDGAKVLNLKDNPSGLLCAKHYLKMHRLLSTLSPISSPLTLRNSRRNKVEYLKKAASTCGFEEPKRWSKEKSLWLYESLITNDPSSLCLGHL